MRHIAIIGSGPAGYYSAEAAQRKFGDDVAVDIIDRLPVPFGLIRTGVAPDHQSIKAVSRRYEWLSFTHPNPQTNTHNHTHNHKQTHTHNHNASLAQTNTHNHTKHDHDK